MDGKNLKKLNGKTYPLNICIFGAASDTISKKKKRTGYAIGRLIGQRGHNLIYGAGTTGMMGAVMNGYLSANPPTKPFGSTTHFIKHVEKSAPEGLIHCVECRTMAERKELYQIADVVLVLAGGEGTYDELSEYKTYKQLNKLDPDAPARFWNGDILLFKHGVYQNYIATWEAQYRQNLAPDWKDSVTVVDFRDLEKLL